MDFIFELVAPVIDEKVVPQVRTALLHSFVFVHGNAWDFCLPAMKNSHLDEMSDAILKYQTNLAQEAGAFDLKFDFVVRVCAHCLRGVHVCI